MLVIRTKFPIATWGYAMLHATMLVRLKPVATQPYSTIQLVTGYEPYISHLRVFSCAVYVPILLPLRIKIGLQRRMRIYVRYDSPSIIRYLEHLTGDLFTAYFADCHFYETVFPLLGVDKNVNVPKERCELLWTTHTLSYLDPRIAQSETETHIRSSKHSLKHARCFHRSSANDKITYFQLRMCLQRWMYQMYDEPPSWKPETPFWPIHVH